MCVEDMRGVVCDGGCLLREGRLSRVVGMMVRKDVAKAGVCECRAWWDVSCAMADGGAY